MTSSAGLSGNQKRKMKSASRLYAVQALFQMEHSSQSFDTVRKEFLEHRFGATYDGQEMIDGDIRHFADLLETAVNYQAAIDQMTARIDPTLRALFRAAGAELRAQETPPRVVINEYVDVARAFFEGGDEPKFVNAVLDHMARGARPEEV